LFWKKFPKLTLFSYKSTCKVRKEFVTISIYKTSIRLLKLNKHILIILIYFGTISAEEMRVYWDGFTWFQHLYEFCFFLILLLYSVQKVNKGDSHSVNNKACVKHEIFENNINGDIEKSIFYEMLHSLKTSCKILSKKIL
jgi:hypothetical protein